MNIAKLTISFDRGLAHNDERDIKVTEGAQIAFRGFKTTDGKIIRGLGTHYESEAIRDLVQERNKDASRIYQEFRARFLATPLEGVYVVNRRGEAAGFVKSLIYRDDIKVYVTEFELTSPGELNTSELHAWGVKIQRQLSSVSLGRSKEADESGLKALESLASCPILKKETGTRIKELVADLRASKITRIELKRNLETLDVQIEQSPLRLEPRRADLAGVR